MQYPRFAAVLVIEASPNTSCSRPNCDGFPVSVGCLLPIYFKEALHKSLGVIVYIKDTVKRNLNTMIIATRDEGLLVLQNEKSHEGPKHKARIGNN